MALLAIARIETSPMPGTLKHDPHGRIANDCARDGLGPRIVGRVPDHTGTGAEFLQVGVHCQGIDGL